MEFKSLAGLAAVAALAFAGAAQADTTVFNSTPADTWFYGGGNDYSPANTAVLTTDAGDQLYLRAHQTGQPAPASVGNVYTFTAAPGKQISFDWGFDTLELSGVTALITITNYAGGTYNYDPLYSGNDNELENGSTQNSARLNWTSGTPAPAGPINFDPNVDASYDVRLDVAGLSGGDKSLTIRIDVGDGFAVPEPSSWALMILGFGGVGATLRRQRREAVTA